MRYVVYLSDGRAVVAGVRILELEGKLISDIGHQVRAAPK
jgi:hypothetical protein